MTEDESRQERLQALLGVMAVFSQELEIERLLRLIMGKVTEILYADRSTLFLLDHDRRELWSKVAQGEGIAEIRFPMHVGLA